jgi:hypothetical protein
MNDVAAHFRAKAAHYRRLADQMRDPDLERLLRVTADDLLARARDYEQARGPVPFPRLRKA